MTPPVASRYCFPFPPAYVRMRYADPRGDLGRVQRQQEFMSSVANQAANPITWPLPWRSLGMADAAGSSLIVDRGTHVWDDAPLALAMGMVSVGAGDSTTVPTEPDTYYVSGQDALKWNTPEALALLDSLGAYGGSLYPSSRWSPRNFSVLTLRGEARSSTSE